MLEPLARAAAGHWRRGLLKPTAPGRPLSPHSPDASLRALKQWRPTDALRLGGIQNADSSLLGPAPQCPAPKSPRSFHTVWMGRKRGSRGPTRPARPAPDAGHQLAPWASVERAPPRGRSIRSCSRPGGGGGGGGAAPLPRASRTPRPRRVPGEAAEDRGPRGTPGPPVFGLHEQRRLELQPAIAPPGLVTSQVIIMLQTPFHQNKKPVQKNS